MHLGCDTNVRHGPDRNQPGNLETTKPIQIFYIGIGEGADLDVGRMLAGATGGAFQAGTEKNLAQLLAEFARWL